MESRVSGNAHARFGVGENPEVSSPKDYLSLYKNHMARLAERAGQSKGNAGGYRSI